MAIFKSMTTMGHEQVVFGNDPETGLKAIIAIHDTTLGPALGGCRFWNYRDEEEALFDVLRLSRGMTYKAAITRLPLGGGKSVIIGDPAQLKSEKFFRSFGRMVNSLGGRYITAEDVNITVEDMDMVALETQYVTGISSRMGSGDPSPVTALGVYEGLLAAVEFKLGKTDLTGLKVAVQGIGSVGAKLCDMLHAQGAKLWIADINDAAVKEKADKLSAEIVGVEAIHASDVDVFAPCALGGILNDETIPDIKAKVIAGAANNQLLEEDKHGRMIADKGILYAPDYLINAGGLINVCQELKGYDREAAEASVKHIYDTSLEAFREAEKQGILTYIACNHIAEKRIAEAAQTQEKFKNNFNNQDWIKIKPNGNIRLAGRC